MIKHYDITVDPEEYYEEILYNFLKNHSKQEIKNILLIDALYEEKCLYIPKRIEGDLK